MPFARALADIIVSNAFTYAINYYYSNQVGSFDGALFQTNPGLFLRHLGCAESEYQQLQFPFS